jgi:hypothetical protein
MKAFDLKSRFTEKGNFTSVTARLERGSILLRGIGTFGPAGSAAARRFVPREGQVVAEEDREAGLALVLAHFGPPVLREAVVSATNETRKLCGNRNTKVYSMDLCR